MVKLDLAKLNDGLDMLDISLLRRRYMRSLNVAERESLVKRMTLLSKQEALEQTIGAFKRSISRFDYGQLEAEEMAVEASQGKVVNDVVNENLIDITGLAISRSSAGEDANVSQGQKNLLEISDFLKRPVKIHADVHNIGSYAYHRLAVWDLFTLEPSVRAKIKNYAYLRGNLHVRISLSGTPFHYGKMIVSYQPYSTLNPTLNQWIAAYGFDSTTFRACLINYLSQSLGSSVMDIRENKPLEIVCPFISTKPMHRLFNTSALAIPNATSFDDMAYAGDLIIASINAISSASSAPTGVYMQIYAWMEDVEVGTNTGTNLAITTESEPMDERKTGPIEKFASRAVKVSNVLKKVSGLEPYATASSMAFGVAGKIAHILGWSKPIIIKPTLSVRNQPQGDCALTIGSDTSQRVVLDEKQELTVDPRVVGIDFDDLVIQHLCSRTSYIKSFPWADTDVPLSSILFSCAINPNLVSNALKVAINYVQPSAMSFATLPFEFWRGDIVFRFEFVCSSFHRGKIAIFYEPNVNHYALITAGLSINKQFMRVVDIQDTTCIEMRVNWAAAKPWLKVASSAQALTLIDDATNIPLMEQYANGFIAVTPFTELQSPDGSDIGVNVYVYSDNMQVNGFSSNNLYSERKVYTQAEPVEWCARASLTPTQMDLNPSSATTKGICQDFFGEQPISFRTLLKRVMTTDVVTSTTANNAQKTMLYVGNIFPNPNMPFVTAFSAVVDLFSYLRYAYLGARGGIRIKIHNCSNHTSSGSGQAKLSFATPGTYSADSLTWGAVGLSVYAWEGSAGFVPLQMASYEAEFPYYSNNYFYFPMLTALDDGQASKNMMEAVWFRQFRFLEDENTSTWTGDKLLIHRAAGEDFTFLRFLGSPHYSKT